MEFGLLPPVFENSWRLICNTARQGQEKGSISADREIVGIFIKPTEAGLVKASFEVMEGMHEKGLQLTCGIEH